MLNRNKTKHSYGKESIYAKMAAAYKQKTSYKENKCCRMHKMYGAHYYIAVKHEPSTDKTGKSRKSWKCGCEENC